MAESLLTNLIESFDSQAETNNLNETITKISNTIQSLHINAENHENKINDNFDTIINNLNAKRNELLTNLQHITNAKSNNLLNQQDALKQALQQPECKNHKNINAYDLRLSTDDNINLAIDMSWINNTISNFASVHGDGYIPASPTIHIKTKNYFKAVIIITNNCHEKNTISHTVQYEHVNKPDTLKTFIIDMNTDNNKSVEYEINPLKSSTKYLIRVSTQTNMGSSLNSTDLQFSTSPTPIWVNNLNQEKQAKEFEEKWYLQSFHDKIRSIIPFSLTNDPVEPQQDIEQLINRLQKFNVPLNDIQWDGVNSAVNVLCGIYSNFPHKFASWKLLYKLFETHFAYYTKYPTSSVMKKFRRIGISMYIDKYPQNVLHTQYEERLASILGMPYRNKLWLENNKNEWSINCKLLHLVCNWYSINSNDKNNFSFVFETCVKRGFAVNAKSGWIVIMSLNNMHVFEPCGSCFRLRATYEFSDAVGVPKLNETDYTKARVRFVNNNIFVWSFSRATIYSFVMSDTNNVYNIKLMDSMQNNYFRDSGSVDIVVTDSLLILLFDRWLGIYKLYPKLEWHHAVAFSKQSVSAHCFEMSYYDDAVDRPPLCDEAYFGDSKKKIICNNNDTSTFEKETHTNYMIINAANQIIGIHPTNPTFHFLHIAANQQTTFCVSKYYGVFYITYDGKSIYQSAHLQSQSVHKILDIKDGKFIDCGGIIAIKPLELVNKIHNVVYDEMYGISGRLLMIVETAKSEYFVQHMFNYQELIHFADDLNKIDYYSVPGILIVYVYSMLYGNEVIQTLLQCHSRKQQIKDD